MPETAAQPIAAVLDAPETREAVARALWPHPWPFDHDCPDDGTCEERTKAETAADAAIAAIRGLVGGGGSA